MKELNLREFANVPVSVAVEELKNLTVDQILVLPEPHRTATIEKLVDERSTDVHFVQNDGEDFTIKFNKQPVVIKSGNHPYPLPVALFILNKFGVGSNKTYGITEREGLVSGEVPESYARPDAIAETKAALEQKAEDLSKQEKALKDLEKELEDKKAELEAKLADVDKPDPAGAAEEPKENKPKGNTKKETGTKV